MALILSRFIISFVSDVMVNTTRILRCDCTRYEDTQNVRQMLQNQVAMHIRATIGELSEMLASRSYLRDETRHSATWQATTNLSTDSSHFYASHPIAERFSISLFDAEPCTTDWLYRA